MAEWAATFSISFKEEPESFTAQFDEYIVVDHDYDPYRGDYTVIPKREDQTLATKGKNMEDDVTVTEVPYAEVSNESGTTYIIASN